jgi:hypothetical protein
MSTFITGSMCLTTLIEKAKEGHSAFTKSAKNGKVYFNYAEWVNDEPNEHGHHSSIQLNSTKEKRDAEGKVYIGNGKKTDTTKPIGKNDIGNDNFDNIPVRQSNAAVSAEINNTDVSDLPF